jgi:hypothetical protein
MYVSRTKFNYKITKNTAIITGTPFQQVTKETLIRGREKTCIKECVDNCRL